MFKLHNVKCIFYQRKTMFKMFNILLFYFQDIIQELLSKLFLKYLHLAIMVQFHFKFLVPQKFFHYLLLYWEDYQH